MPSDFAINTFFGNFDEIPLVIDNKEEVVLKKCIDIRWWSYDLSRCTATDQIQAKAWQYTVTLRYYDVTLTVVAVWLSC